MASKGLMAASTKPLILTILLDGENYGYRIIQRVKALSEGSLEWSDGMLYPVLHRLEKEGFIQSRWVVTDRDRKRRYYNITAPGVRLLEADQRDWMSVHEVFARLWNLPPATL